MRSRRPDTEPSDAWSFLPLPAAAMYILTALGEGPKHGYGLMTDIRALSGGTVQLGPGTLYGSIKRMLDQGLITDAEARPDPELDDERRRYYQLTGLGAEVAAAEHARLDHLVAAARTRFPRPVLPGMPA